MVLQRGTTDRQRERDIPADSGSVQGSTTEVVNRLDLRRGHEINENFQTRLSAVQTRHVCRCHALARLTDADIDRHTQALVVSRIEYALPSFSGFLSRTDMDTIRYDTIRYDILFALKN